VSPWHTYGSLVIGKALNMDPRFGLASLRVKREGLLKTEKQPMKLVDLDWFKEIEGLTECQSAI
jgi:hypothetical protein